MNAKGSIILVVLAVCSVQCGSALLGLGHSRLDQKALDEINSYLSDSVQSDDVSANFEAAEKWLESIRGGKKAGKNLLHTLEKVVSLKDASERCDTSARQVVQEMYDYMGLVQFKKSVEPDRRIDQIVKRFIDEYYEKCRSKDVEAAKGIVSAAAMNEATDKFFTDFIKERMKIKFPGRKQTPMELPLSYEYLYRYNKFEGTNERDLSTTRMEGVWFLDSLTKGTADEGITKPTLNEETGKMDFNLARVAQLVETNVVEPCSKIYPAIDSKTLLFQAYFAASQKGKRNIDELDRDTLELLAKQKLCKSVVSDKGARFVQLIGQGLVDRYTR